MIPRYWVKGSEGDRPEAARVVFADGSADASFREGTDLELSHWVPNRTPAAFKADTSTEICLEFSASPPDEEYDLAINNHLDVDGLLCLYALTRGAGALPHRDLLVRAAECGDFSNWAPADSFRLYQALTLLMEEGGDVGATYARAFELVDRFVEGEEPDDPRIAAGADAIERGVEAIETGRVMVAVLGETLMSFLLPPLEGEELARALRVPAFNELVTDACWLWPQVRNRFDDQRVHLVAIPTHGGIHYDLWYPGYMWAETPHRWRAPGFTHAESTNAYLYGHEPLEEAVRALQAAEPGQGTWALARELTPFSSLKGRGFPVVLSCVDGGGEPAVSGLDPERVYELLAPAFDAAAIP